MGRFLKLTLIFFAGSVLIVVGLYLVYRLSLNGMIDMIDKTQKREQSAAVRQQDADRTAIVGEPNRDQ